MGGKIRVESVYGKGSSFIFTGRFGIHMEKRGLFLPEPDLRGKRFLVVDDNRISRKIMQEMLESMKFSASFTDSEGKAIDEIRQADKLGNPFEIVFMDWRMFEQGCLSGAKKFKMLDLSQQPKIILVTAHGHDDVREQVEYHKFDGFLVKPVERSVLFDTIMGTFGRERTGQSNDRINKDLNFEEFTNIRGARILLAEDNEINQQVAKEILEQAALVVEIAKNGRVALEMLSKNNYDLVLMDIQMPVLNGIEAIKEIRNLEGYVAETPIVAMTAHAMTGDRGKSLDAGMNTT